ncbi:MAG: hypothetical protein K2H20_00430 [Bacilli bacterium]|nr:hypothetical protein [Bacilli bacterium]
MDYRDREIYENARRNSVNRSQEQAQVRIVEYTKKDLRDARRDAYRKGATAGLKKGFMSAAIIAVLICGGIKLGGSAIDAITTNYNNESVEAGYAAVNLETHRTQDNQGYWYDYYDIAKAFDAETMDFDSFVYGSYRNVGWNAESRLSCMDELFSQFKLCGLTDCSSFLAYCEEKGLCKEVDGQVKVDMKAYEQAIKEYLASLSEVQELEENIDSFRRGK